MPDESCRSCGGGLRTHSQCSGCRRAVQKICQTCNTITRRQFHYQCERHEYVSRMQNDCALETVARRRNIKFYSLRSISIFVGIAGFFILGFSTAAYLDLFQDLSPSSNASAIGSPTPGQSGGSATGNVIQNCLAYGSGESVTVTCPTQYGYVYKAILDMPKDLASKFSDSVFSIRGVSLVENSDATVVLQYQDRNYLTSFFGN